VRPIYRQMAAKTKPRPGYQRPAPRRHK
jgi:hypothetical protein